MVDTMRMTSMPFAVPLQGTPRRAINIYDEGASLTSCGVDMTHADHPDVLPSSVFQAARALQALRNGCEPQAPVDFAPWPALYTVWIPVPFQATPRRAINTYDEGDTSCT